MNRTLFPAITGSHLIGTAGVKASLEVLADPLACVRVFFSHYAFARRGKDRSNSIALANESLDRWAEESASVFDEHNAERLWDIYEEVCILHHKKSLEQLNRGVIAGIAELAQEIYQDLDGASLATWIATKAKSTHRVEDCFLRLVDVRGIGPKTTSLFVRDVIYLFDLEATISHVDRLYLQPIDGTLRVLAPLIIDEEGIDQAADWILAGKLARAARRSGVSGIRFNMGAQYYGSIEGSRAAVMIDHLEFAFSGRTKEDH